MTCIAELVQLEDVLISIHGETDASDAPCLPCRFILQPEYESAGMSGFLADTIVWRLQVGVWGDHKAFYPQIFRGQSRKCNYTHATHTSTIHVASLISLCWPESQLNLLCPLLIS